MKLKSFNAEYNVCEFHHYVNYVDGDTVSVVELLMDCPLEKFVEKDLTSIFVIEDEKQTYVFSWYKVDEFYEVDELVKVVLVK